MGTPMGVDTVMPERILKPEIEKDNISSVSDGRGSPGLGEG